MAGNNNIYNFPGPLERGPQPPDDGGMDPRIDRLEEHVGNLRVDYARIDARLQNVVDNMATKTWILGGVVAVLLAILGACAWLAQTYLTPILQATGKQ